MFSYKIRITVNFFHRKDTTNIVYSLFLLGNFICMWKKNIHLELVSKVYEETGLFGMIAVSDGSTQRAEYGVVVISGLYAKEDTVVK